MACQREHAAALHSARSPERTWTERVPRDAQQPSPPSKQERVAAPPHVGRAGAEGRERQTGPAPSLVQPTLLLATPARALTWRGAAVLL
eukprot:2407637-Pleurochrysis_carterae.AAC.1